MGMFEHDAPPPPVNRMSTWRWSEDELRELADALRKQGWSAITADNKEDAKSIASSLASALMRRKDLWPARNGEGLSRYLGVRTAVVDGKAYGYVVVSKYFVGSGDNSRSLVRLYADGSRVQVNG